ncbi:MAG: chemotaxis protein CheW [Candidatus Rifleibacteriota bacterium]
MSLSNDELLREFLAETNEQLAGIENDLLLIEEQGQNIDEDLVNKVFRAAHSIKGGSSLFGLKKIQELSHKTESVLDLIRSRVICPNAEVVNVLLISFDKLRDLLNNVYTSNSIDISDNLVQLAGLATSFLSPEEKGYFHQPAAVKLPPGAFLNVSEMDLELARKSGHHVYYAEYDLIEDIDGKGKNLLDIQRLLVAFGKIIDSQINAEAVGTLEQEPSSTIPFHVLFATEVGPDEIEMVLELPAEKIKLLVSPDKNQPEAPPPLQIEGISGPEIEVIASSESGQAKAKEKLKPGISAPASSGVDKTLRVSVEVLETLMNLAGELVLSRNQLRESLSINDFRGVHAGSQRVSLVTSELQEAIMQTRMQPIGNVFGKFPRVVRDMARSQNKEIQLVVEGKDVEMDKTLIEGLNDPLTHMIRNSCDHGIESPEERKKKGKPITGKIILRAFHEAGQVIVEIIDDGRGIDPVKIAASAVAKGLISSDRIQGMSEAEKTALIFLPGLSTAEKLSEISGRGVGMDVVKSNLDQLGGKVEIESKVGDGTRFCIKLPLTLAIIPSLVVAVEKERFAIPQINVLELTRVPAAQIQSRIEIVGDAEVMKLREKLLPIVSLAEVLGIKKQVADNETGQSFPDRRRNIADRRSRRSPLKGSIKIESENKEISTAEIREATDRRYHACDDLNIVVISTGTFQYGMIVDQFFNTEEIVVKPLGRHLKSLQEYAGATIMGDGKVALIIDAAGLAAKAAMRHVAGTDRAAMIAAETAREKLCDALSFLTFHNRPDELCCVPMGLVQRIERIGRNQVEFSAGRRTMQYRGNSLPLVTLSDAADVKPISEDQSLAVIVSSLGNREVGLLVAMPVDVIEAGLNIDQTTHRNKGIAGSAIFHDRVMLVVDLVEIVQTVFNDWNLEDGADRQTQAEGRFILLAEDSDFFRSQVKRFIESEGFQVIEAADGQTAWELLCKMENRIEAVVTDIEMPRLNGLGLARNIRADKRFAEMPVIGLTSLAGEEDIEQGKAAGITDYQIKLDRDQLLESLRRNLSRNLSR